MIHAIISAALTLLAGVLFGQWLIGALIAAAFYVGREHAQAEYRWIEWLGDGSRSNMPWWGGFDPKVWSHKSLTDFALPALVLALCVAVGG